MRFLRRMSKPLAAIGLAVGVLGVGVVGPASPAGALPPPIFYCEAFKPHTGDVVSTAEIFDFGPGVVTFYCESYHWVGAARDYHCYFVVHEDGVNPSDPGDDEIYWVPLSC